MYKDPRYFSKNLNLEFPISLHGGGMDFLVNDTFYFIS